MLTLIESISLAGSRAKQNDDAFGWSPESFWVLDGATDLYDPPVMGAASDAAWLAHRANRYLTAHAHGCRDMVALVAAAAHDCQTAFDAVGRAEEPWRRPAATLVLAWETESGVGALDLGDSRLFALDAAGRSFAVGGRGESADEETRQVLAVTGGNNKSPLNRADVIDALRERHRERNVEGGWWVFAPDPRCAKHARRHSLDLARPAHLLAMTDGFAALADRYGAYDPAGLVAAALDKGLAALGLELRAIETNDADGAAHPRWKRSDDATAILVRLD